MHVAKRAAIVVSALAAVVQASWAAHPAKYVWVEGESCTNANFKWDAAGGAVLSDGKYLNFVVNKADVAKFQKDGGAQVEYKVSVPEAGKYEFWARIGYEWLRSPLEWSIDDNEAKTITPKDMTTSLMSVGAWAEVGWLKLAAVDLKQGDHKVQFKCTQPGGDGRIMLAIDCLNFVQGENVWTPEGYLKPGESYNTENDKAAKAAVYGRDGQGWKNYMGRDRLDLSGLWQVTRYDDPDMARDSYEPVKITPEKTGQPLQWMSVSIPGKIGDQRPELVFGHRLYFRTKVFVPAEKGDKAFMLHFNATCWILSVFINGEYAGDYTSVEVPWDLDITKQIKAGRENDVVIAVKSPYYAIDPDFNQMLIPPKEPRNLNFKRNLPGKSDVLRFNGYFDCVFGTTGTQAGFQGPVYLVAAGKAYTSDIFIRTSVQKKQLDADVEVSNSGGAEADVQVVCEAVNDRDGRVEKAFAAKTVKVPAGGKGSVSLSEAWADAKLWWPEPDAQCYRMRTTLTVDGRVADVREDTFGFREVTLNGRNILINGIIYHFWNFQDISGNDPQKFAKTYRDRNYTFIRAFQGGIGKDEPAMENYDRLGIALSAPTNINGMYCNFDMTDPLVWKNFDRHVQQFVRAFRNHPSILFWSLENELLLVNGGINSSANMKKDPEMYGKFEKGAAKLLETQRRIDPTREGYFDGGGDVGGLARINNHHYTWTRGEIFPNSAYNYPIGPTIQPRKALSKVEKFLWNGNSPLIFGEAFFYTLGNPDQSWIGGPQVYRGTAYQNSAAGLYCKICVEGARWQDAAGLAIWNSSFKETLGSFRPKAVFVREWDSCFYGGESFERTIKVFNDTRFADTLTLKWSLTAVSDGKTIEGGHKDYKLEPGHSQEDKLSIHPPQVQARTDCSLKLELYSRDKLVYDEARPVSIFPAFKAPTIKSGILAVYDPGGKVAAWLKNANYAFADLKSLTAPAGVQVLLVGPNAWDVKGRAAAAQTIKDFVDGGGTAIIMEQTAHLQGDDLPIKGVEAPKPSKPAANKGQWEGMAEFDTKAKGDSGRITHPSALAHPALAGVKSSDLFTWKGDGYTFRGSYFTPATEVICIIQAGDVLGLSPLMEVMADKGSYLLSQMDISAKLDTEPAAGLLLSNYINWALQRSGGKAKEVVTFLGGDADLQKFLNSAGITGSEAQSLEQAVSSPDRVVVVRGSADAMKQLAAMNQKVQDFCDKGGWLVVSNLDDKALDSFNALTGCNHRIRKFEKTAVKTDAYSDKLLLGLSDRYFAQLGTTYIAPWVQKYDVADDVFSSVVDGTEIGGFSACPNRNLFNGLTNAESWQYTQYLHFTDDENGNIIADEKGNSGLKIEMSFGREETFTGFNVVMSKVYYIAKDIKVIFDDDEKSALKFTLDDSDAKQEVRFDAPRKAKKVTIQILSHNDGPSTKDMRIVTIDALELFRQLPADWKMQPVFLTAPAGLVKYPIGKGGVVLNQLTYTAPDSGDDSGKGGRGAENLTANYKKKQAIWTNILRNLKQ